MCASDISKQALPDLEEMRPHARSAAQLMRLLANEHRLMVLCALADGERSVGELLQQVPLSQSALSQHLAQLREHGLVATRREAQSIRYSLVPGPALALMQTLKRVYCPVATGGDA